MTQTDGVYRGTANFVDARWSHPDAAAVGAGLRASLAGCYYFVQHNWSPIASQAYAVLAGSPELEEEPLSIESSTIVSTDRRRVYMGSHYDSLAVSLSFRKPAQDGVRLLMQIKIDANTALAQVSKEVPGEPGDLVRVGAEAILGTTLKASLDTLVVLQLETAMLNGDLPIRYQPMVVSWWGKTA